MDKLHAMTTFVRIVERRQPDARRRGAAVRRCRRSCARSPRWSSPRRAAPQPHDAAPAPHRRGRAVSRAMPRDPVRGTRRRGGARRAARGTAGPHRDHRAGAVRPALRGAAGGRVPRAACGDNRASCCCSTGRSTSCRKASTSACASACSPIRRWSRFRVGTLRRVVCASPAYLRRHGVPQAPDDLRRHVAVRFAGLTPGAEWRLRDRRRTVGVAVRDAARVQPGGRGRGRVRGRPWASACSSPTRSRRPWPRSGCATCSRTSSCRRCRCSVDLSAVAAAVGHGARVRRPGGAGAAGDALRVSGLPRRATLDASLNRPERTAMDAAQQRAVLTLCLMAAVADGGSDDRERAQLRQVTQSLGAQGGGDLAARLRGRAAAQARSRDGGRRADHAGVAAVRVRDGGRGVQRRRRHVARPSAISSRASRGAGPAPPRRRRRSRRPRMRWPPRRCAAPRSKARWSRRCPRTPPSSTSRSSTTRS